MRTNLEEQLDQYIDDIKDELGCTEERARDILAKALYQNSSEIFITLNEVYIGEGKK